MAAPGPQLSRAGRATVVTFWNVDERVSLTADIAILMKETGSDILVLGETGNVHAGLDLVLQQVVDPCVRHLTPYSGDVHVWTKLDEKQIALTRSEDRFEAFKVRTMASETTLIVFAHLRSKSKRSAEEEALDTEQFLVALRMMEQAECPAERTVVAGDLNLRPFDPAMMMHRLFGASASRTIVERKPTMRRRGQEHARFYNPSWRLLNDSNGPPGTYFWKDDTLGGNWYCVDQVLLRGALIPSFMPETLRVVTSIGGRTLIARNGKPAPNWSDHLPITFALET